MGAREIEDILLNAGLYAQYDITEKDDVLIYGYIYLGKVDDVKKMSPDDVVAFLNRYFGEPANPNGEEPND